MTLMLTPMIDIFTILLLFLLKSYSTAEFKLTPPESIQLPQSTTKKDADLALQLLATKDAIFVDEEKVVPIVKGRIPSKYLDRRDPLIIRPLVEKLKVHNRIAQIKTQTNKDYRFEGRVIFTADASTPFYIIKKVMYSAELERFNLFNFAVVKKE